MKSCGARWNPSNLLRKYRLGWNLLRKYRLGWNLLRRWNQIRLSYSREAGFHHEVISSTEGGFLPPEADLTEKALAFASFFSWCGQEDMKSADLLRRCGGASCAEKTDMKCLPATCRGSASPLTCIKSKRSRYATPFCFWAYSIKMQLHIFSKVWHCIVMFAHFAAMRGILYFILSYQSLFGACPQRWHPLPVQ